MKSFLLFLLMAWLGFTGCSMGGAASRIDLQFTPVELQAEGVELADQVTLTDGTATVMSGSLDGLVIAFAQPEQEDQLHFELQLPSVDGFRVWETYATDDQGDWIGWIESDLAPLPLTLTEEDFLTSVDAFEQPAPATLDVNVWNRNSPNSFEVDYFRFSDFELTIAEFRIEENRLWMDATLNGSMDPLYLEYTGALYDLSATLSLEGVPLGLMEVD